MLLNRQNLELRPGAIVRSVNMCSFHNVCTCLEEKHNEKQNKRVYRGEGESVPTNQCP